MKKCNRDWARVAAAQAGVFTVLQAKAAGISPWECRRRASQGLWVDVGHGIYRVAGAAQSWHQSVWIACLETRGLASHRTAGRLWGLDGLDRAAPAIEVVVPMKSGRTSRGALVHHSRSLLDSHRYRGSGIPRTHLPRTLLDLSEVLGAEDLAQAVASAIRRSPYVLPWLRRMLDELSTRGHRHVNTLRDLISGEYRSVDSAFEVRLRRWMRGVGLPLPVTGYKVHDGKRIFAKLDFAWPDNYPRVALMAQSIRWHGNTTRWKIDMTQSTQLSALGWRVLQCSVDDIRHNADWLLRSLRRALAGFESPRGEGAATPAQG